MYCVLCTLLYWSCTVTLLYWSCTVYSTILELYCELCTVYSTILELYCVQCTLLYWNCNVHCVLYYTGAPSSLAATLTSAEGSKKFHYNILAPLHFTCWMNTFEGSKNSEVGSYIFFSLSMYTFKCGLANPRFYKILAGPVHMFKCFNSAREEAVWAQLESNQGPISPFYP